MCHNVNRKKEPKFFQNTSIERFEIISGRVCREPDMPSRQGYGGHIGERTAIIGSQRSAPLLYSFSTSSFYFSPGSYQSNKR